MFKHTNHVDQATKIYRQTTEKQCIKIWYRTSDEANLNFNLSKHLNERKWKKYFFFTGHKHRLGQKMPGKNSFPKSCIFKKLLFGAGVGAD